VKVFWLPFWQKLKWIKLDIKRWNWKTKIWLNSEMKSMKSKKFKGKTLNTIEASLNGSIKCYFIFCLLAYLYLFIVLLHKQRTFMHLINEFLTAINRIYIFNMKGHLNEVFLNLVNFKIINGQKSSFRIRFMFLRVCSFQSVDIILWVIFRFPRIYRFYWSLFFLFRTPLPSKTRPKLPHLHQHAKKWRKLRYPLKWTAKPTLQE
jgi:hypothetical protein